MTMTRRTFVLAGTAAALAGCREAPPPLSPTLMDQLRASGLFFVERDGRAVDPNDISGKWGWGEKYVTLSFMYNGCDKYCTPNAAQLALSSKRDSNLRHLALAVNPAIDYANAQADKAAGLEGFLTSAGLKTGPYGNTRVLYPATSLGPPPQFADDATISALQATSFSLMAGGRTSEKNKDGSQVILHNGSILLYDGNGRQVGGTITELVHAADEIARRTGPGRAAVR